MRGPVRRSPVRARGGRGARPAGRPFPGAGGPVRGRRRGGGRPAVRGPARSPLEPAPTSTTWPTTSSPPPGRSAAKGALPATFASTRPPAIRSRPASAPSGRPARRASPSAAAASAWRFCPSSPAKSCPATTRHGSGSTAGCRTDATCCARAWRSPRSCCSPCRPTERTATSPRLCSTGWSPRSRSGLASPTPMPPGRCPGSPRRRTHRSRATSGSPPTRCASSTRDRERWRAYGHVNFGDWNGEGDWSWGNNEYDTPYCAYWEFLRGGEPGWATWGAQSARHLADVDTVNAFHDARHVGAAAHAHARSPGRLPAGLLPQQGPRHARHPLAHVGRGAAAALPADRRRGDARLAAAIRRLAPAARAAGPLRVQRRARGRLAPHPPDHAGVRYRRPPRRQRRRRRRPPASWRSRTPQAPGRGCSPPATAGAATPTAAATSPSWSPSCCRPLEALLRPDARGSGRRRPSSPAGDGWSARPSTRRPACSSAEAARPCSAPRRARSFGTQIIIEGVADAFAVSGDPEIGRCLQRALPAIGVMPDLEGHRDLGKQLSSQMRYVPTGPRRGSRNPAPSTRSACCSTELGRQAPRFSPHPNSGLTEPSPHAPTYRCARMTLRNPNAFNVSPPRTALARYRVTLRSFPHSGYL